MSELISVVVPVYGVEKFLHLCVDSILNQTYKNLEVFLVDDGSPDRCGQWCEEYAAKDARITVVHKKNGGLSDARNAVMDRLHGEYVIFVDSDDFLDIHYVENLYFMMKEHQADIAVCGWNEIDENHIVLPEIVKLNPENTQCWERMEALRRLLYQVPIDNAVWPKMFRTALFQGIYFPQGKLYEDFAVMYKIFSRAERVCYNPYGGYQYMIRGTGIMLQNFSERKMHLIDFAEEMKEVMLQQYPELQSAVWSRFFRANCHIYLQIPTKPEYRDFQKRIENNLKISRAKVIKDAFARRGTRLAACSTYLGFPLFRGMRRWKKVAKK